MHVKQLFSESMKIIVKAKLGKTRKRLQNSFNLNKTKELQPPLKGAKLSSHASKTAFCVDAPQAPVGIPCK